MKKLIFLTLIQSLILSQAFAQDIIARVSEIQGDAFVFESTTKSKALKYGDKLKIGAEVMVDDTSYITLIDERENVYHVSGGSHLSFSKNGLQIKNGKVWVKANGKQNSELEALHSSMQFKEGQFIVDTNNLDDKTQVMVMTGNVNFYNPLEPTLMTNIDAGQFSFISPKFESGIPRSATRIGVESYKALKLAFSNIKSTHKYKTDLIPLEKNQPVQRSIASVQVDTPTQGKILFFKATKPSRKVASADPYSYYKNLNKKKVVKKSPTKSAQCNHPDHVKGQEKVIVKKEEVPAISPNDMPIKTVDSGEGKIQVTLYNGSVSKDELQKLQYEIQLKRQQYLLEKQRQQRMPSSVSQMKHYSDRPSDIVSEINSLDI